ncbi:acetyltransferase-like isoleucine patch superfamily enzyme [Paenibacillus anaericanus]|uniref:acyltransferase n=1 Tax=Paenibacillus anaericanus TaxID=170367 RepID=UPI00278875AB|nr:acyltransferase [Paenibacillus anaericanus]MDQ0089979.1 acetyltransferase-like isoleucine patch superfamily enzyme [Paenibacillus anaericanus]
MLFFKRKETFVFNNGDNTVYTETSKFSRSTVNVDGNQNTIHILENGINDTNVNVCGNSNNISIEHITLDKSKISIKGNHNTVTIGKDCSMNNLEIYIHGDNHQLVIGEAVEVYGGLSLWFEDYDNKIIIGNYTTFGFTKFAIAEPNTEITIGRDCMFANGVTVKNSDFHSIIDLNSNRRINPAGNIIIGNHVWFGENSHILKNVTIQDNSIVALGSIVTKNIPSNCVVAGSPGKVIKEHVTWARPRTF